MGGPLGVAAAATGTLALSGLFGVFALLDGPLALPARLLSARYSALAAGLSALVLALACARVAGLPALDPPSIAGAIAGAGVVCVAIWRPPTRPLLALSPVVLALALRLLLSAPASAQGVTAMVFGGVAAAFASRGASAQATVQTLATVSIVYCLTQPTGIPK
jgi:hypothetical protein